MTNLRCIYSHHHRLLDHRVKWRCGFPTPGTMELARTAQVFTCSWRTLVAHGSRHPILWKSLLPPTEIQSAAGMCHPEPQSLSVWWQLAPAWHDFCSGILRMPRQENERLLWEQKKGMWGGWALIRARILCIRLIDSYLPTPLHVKHDTFSPSSGKCSSICTIWCKPWLRPPTCTPLLRWHQNQQKRPITCLQYVAWGASYISVFVGIGMWPAQQMECKPALSRIPHGRIWRPQAMSSKLAPLLRHLQLTWLTSHPQVSKWMALPAVLFHELTLLCVRPPLKSGLSLRSPSLTNKSGLCKLDQRFSNSLASIFLPKSSVNMKEGQFNRMSKVVHGYIHIIHALIN